MIVDLVSNDFDESVTMLKRFINYCKENKINNVKFAISNKELIKEIEKNLTVNLRPQSHFFILEI